MVRSAWLSKFVKLPSGRSHRSIPFWDVMHQCARVVLFLRWCSLRGGLQTGCAAALVTNSSQRWRKRCCVPAVDLSRRLAYSGHSSALSGSRVRLSVCLLVCLRPLASHPFAAAQRPHSRQSADKIRQYRRHGFPIRMFAARDGSEVRGVPGL